MLEVENLSINYINHRIHPIKNVSFELPEKSICLLLSDTSSWQTVLCYTLAGVLKHAQPETDISGSIKWKGNLIDQYTFHPEITITLENPYVQFSGLKNSILEELAFGLELRGISRIEMVRKIKDTADLFCLSHLLSQNPKNLSGGETQKAVIGSAYIISPELWILDKPLTELDPMARVQFLEILKQLSNENGTTIIIAENPSSDIYKIATHLLKINQHKVELSLNTKENQNSQLENRHSFPQNITLTKSTNYLNSDKTSITPSIQIKNL